MSLETLSTNEGELEGFPRWQWTQGHFYAVRKVKLDYSQRRAALQELDTPTGSVYPYAEGPNDAIARRVKGDPWAAQTNAVGEKLASYDSTILTIYYSTEGPHWYNGIQIDEWLTPYTEAHAVDRSKLSWGSSTPRANPLVINELVQKEFHSFTWSIHYHRISATPGWLESRVGYCNSNHFASPTLGIIFAPKTVKYQPPTLKRTFSYTGLPTWDAWVHYTFRPVTWHKHWRADKQNASGGYGDFDTLYVVSGGEYKNVPETNFVFMP